MTRLVRKMTEEVKQKIGEGNKGKIRTAEHKAKITEGLKRYWASLPAE